ncbi:metal ABC transporter ATP-binding protein [Effusibacillus lacus]|uniref:Zinc ABC transporter ATP-binding protein n=1 Tax=Effusibacillus lacus TaxID=1348429 RepID=A0A292YM38_9BACL|nr:metal ABC transporter ATP-binding protein [Effusibacillus lacus]TCS71439.1 zinc transport system ATP-binding protein [Effusibacillus lacus]GAX89969.1 zinc ABC transporter ATP-binding protein [Effusibacillus lacus]
MSQTPVIELRNVYFQYGDRPAVEDLNLVVHEGEFLGIIGPNGAGKSTALKLMLGLLRPVRGDVLLFGRPLSEFKDWSKIGYVSQKAASFNTRFPATVTEVVETGLLGKKGTWWSWKENKRRVAEALELVGMREFADRRIGDLSGGQQQRVFIARALVGDPELILLDEPVEGVDAEAQGQFYDILDRLNKVHGITLVIVSHDIGTISNKVGQLACINKTLHYHGSPQEFMEGGDLSGLYGHDVKLVHHHH